ncbi:hypothetical protein C8D93_103131 [Sinimarinibacterium flocculans]|uniref:Uncharacterized protein n=2 Tax=Sinimarinibacterium flocculans TaxID=985250 RepID=A0A318EAF0_9GAMM|nr:hypothetical protein C8D93_103131 [Sinimarinibacterium flocculans]
MQGFEPVWRALPAGVFLGASLFLGACGGGGGGDGDNAIDPADADALTQALAVKVSDSQAVLVAGDLPASSEDDAAPVVVPGDEAVDARAGSTVELAVDVTSSDGADLSALFAKVPGAADYFQATLAPGGSKRLPGGKLLTALVVSVTLPQNVRDGRFCFSIKVADSTGLISNLAEVCVDVGEPDDSGAQVVEALQGTWYLACNVGDGESFSGSLEVSGNTITTTESLYLNTDCSGSPVDSYQETLEFAVGAQAQASDGGDAFEIDITNLSEGGTALCLIRVEQSRFLLGCGDESVRATVLENEFTREPESSAKACFNPVLYETGTQVVEQVRRTFREQDPGGPTPVGGIIGQGEFTRTTNTLGPGSFNGRNVVELQFDEVGDASVIYEGEESGTEYVEVDAAAPSLGFAGVQYVSQVRESYDPPILFPFNLQEGESLTYTISFNEVDINEDTGELEESSGTFPLTVTYAGREVVNVAAGAIETCRFEFFVPGGDDGEDDPFTEFLGVGTGLEVLFYETDPATGVETDRDELVGATINGVTVY